MEFGSRLESFIHFNSMSTSRLRLWTERVRRSHRELADELNVTRQSDPRRGRSLRSGAVTRQALLERTAASSLAAVLEVTVLVGTVGMVAILVANSVNAWANWFQVLAAITSRS